MNIHKLLENVAGGNPLLSQLVIPDCNGFRVIVTTELILCEADRYCTHFHLTSKEKTTSSKDLKHYEELLASQGFLRVHNSYLVNLAHIKSYNNQGEILLTGKIKCPLGNAYKAWFLERFRRLK